MDPLVPLHGLGNVFHPVFREISLVLVSFVLLQLSRANSLEFNNKGCQFSEDVSTSWPQALKIIMRKFFVRSLVKGKSQMGEFQKVEKFTIHKQNVSEAACNLHQFKNPLYLLFGTKTSVSRRSP
jgi:hypothetical protein